MKLGAPSRHDVIVVGSGASGGMAAYNLAEKGIQVLMLDAGGTFEREKFWTHVSPYEWRERQKRGEKPIEFFLSTQEQPYLTPEKRPFKLTRVWGLGGKTNVWGRVSLRMSDLNFRAAEIDGWGIPWPIGYQDIAPYYDKVEQLIGVCGGDDDSDALPGSRFLLPAPAPRCGEFLVRKAASKLHIPVVAIRRANLTRPHRGFAPCHYCGACDRGCDTASFFCTADHLIPFALKTGKLTIVPNAVVARILIDAEGKASGVQYFDRHSGKERAVYGRIIVLGASCADSTRILLNSKSEKFPNGMGNGSDQLGRNYCEQVMIHLQGFLPRLFGRPTTNDDGFYGEHIYIPRFNHRVHKGDYLRGFGIQCWGTGCQPTGAEVAKRTEGFGTQFKREVKRLYPSLVQFHPFGEVLPRPENRITVDERQTDRYGVPLMRISVTYGDNERRMVTHMYQIAEEILHTAGAQIVPPDRQSHEPPGSAIHEHGTCRMGTNPKNSVLNQFNQMHEVKNLFVVDGSSFSSASEKNPTLTILALAWRATDFLAEEMRTGNL